MNPRIEKIIICGFLVGYAVIGAFLRYYITFPSDPNWNGTHILFGVASIPYIAIGIGWGLHSLIYPNPAKRSRRYGQAVVVGLSIGFGGMTILILAFDAMKYFFGCKPI